MKDFNKYFDIFFHKAMPTMDPRTFMPFDNFALQRFYSKTWINKIIDAVNKLKDLDDKELKDVFQSSSPLRIIPIFILFDLKIAKIPKEKRLDIANFFDKLTRLSIINNDLYGENSNIHHSKEEIDKLLRILKPSSKEINTELGKLHHSAANLCWSLYTDYFYSGGFDIYGPYNINYNGENSILVIKNFYNIKPIELWPESGILKHKSIKIVALYKDIKFRTDIIIHTTYDKNPIEHQKYFAVVLDNKVVTYDISKLKEIRRQIEELAHKHYNEYLKLDFEGKKKLFLYQMSYLFKPLFDKAGIDWKPDKELVESVKDKELQENTYYSDYEELRKIFDPEIDVYP